MSAYLSTIDIYMKRMNSFSCEALYSLYGPRDREKPWVAVNLDTGSPETVRKKHTEGSAGICF